MASKDNGGILFDFSKARLGGSKQDLPFGVFMAAVITAAAYIPKEFTDRETGQKVTEKRLELKFKVEHEGISVSDSITISPRQGWLLARFLDAVGVDVTKLTTALTEKFIQDKLVGKTLEVKYKPDPATDGSGRIWHRLAEVQKLRLPAKVTAASVVGDDEDDVPFDASRTKTELTDEDEDDE